MNPGRQRCAALLPALCAALASCPSGVDAPPGTGAVEGLAADPRLSYLLAPCAKNEHYDVDTADVLAILRENLLRGQRDPLRRAKQELAELGPEGLAVARRVVTEHFASPDGGPHLRNAIEVAQRSEAPEARELLLDALACPEWSVALQAVAGLAKHGRAADYAAVRALFERIDPEFKDRVAFALHALDPVQAAHQYLDWIEAEEWPGLWDGFGQRVASTVDPGVVERCCATWPRLAPRFQAGFAAPCARAGDAKALARLRELLTAAAPDLRRMALECASRAELVDEVAAALARDPDPQIRAIAAASLATPERAASRRADLRAAIADRSFQVVVAALHALAKDGDPTAIERALALLGEPAALVEAMNVLQEPMERDPALARRVLERLSALRAAESHRPLADQLPLLQAIGRVPLEDSARILVELAGGASGSLGGVGAHRWLLLQAGNAREPGQRVLLAELPRERDPLHRIDLLEAIASQGGAFAKGAMLAHIEDDATPPYEVLYAADRATRLGTTAEVAPVLKRAALRTTQPDVRLALQCMLWANYPGPR